MSTLPATEPAAPLPPLVVIFRGLDTNDVVSATAHLVDIGVEAFEVTLNSPKALTTIEKLGATVPSSVRIGAGTVVTTAEVRRAVDAGAGYLISPHVDAELVALTNELGALSVPGATTPTEVQAAWSAGASLVKLFPVGPLGIDYLRQLKGPFPQIPFFASGGVDAALAAACFGSGCPVVGVGAELFDREAVRNRDWETLALAASSYLAAAGLPNP